MVCLGNIFVSPTNIAKGTRNHPNRCPIAHALREHFSEASSVDINGHRDIQCIGVHWSAQIHFRKAHLSFDIPLDVVEKINVYDRDGVMEPFTFPIYL